jgi:peptidoglycan/xylan/chitin deacetylase (PgdA/CDA1 family)
MSAPTTPATVPERGAPASGPGGPGAAAAAPQERDEYYLYERYLGDRARSRLLAPYYALKPVIPRGVQLALRRRYARRQARRAFPAWPVEPILLERHYATLREQLRQSASGELPIVNLWPRRGHFAFVLTHDVEGPKGVANIGRVRELERRHGCVSSWNFVAEDYPIPSGCFERLRQEGCEIGLHGITHDGKLFQSRARFEADLPKIHAYLARWGAVGFRSPATGRRADWMHELGCLYDSSFPDTDPFEPQPGGCCSILPFHFGEVVELPITLVQDHTLLEILQSDTIDPWVRKSEWLMRQHGLVNLITHPDYLDTPARLAMYDRFLAFLSAQSGAWHALPHEVAEWWNRRRELRLAPTAGGRMVVESNGRMEGLSDATVAIVREDGERLRIDT